MLRGIWLGQELTPHAIERVLGWRNYCVAMYVGGKGYDLSEELIRHICTTLTCTI
jgi:hypothetical protein